MTLDTILKRNNSIGVVKKHAIPFSSLHKKTYFNALEKILISPRNISIEDEDLANIHDSTTRAFEEVFRNPPTRLDNEYPQLKMGKKQGSRMTDVLGHESMESSLSGS